MKELYLYSEKHIHNIIKEMFINFKIHTISIEKIKKNEFTNHNILLIADKSLIESLSKSLFLNNNIVIYTENKNLNKNFYDAKVLYKHIHINKFIDEVTAFFVESSINYRDIKIFGEKIINKITEKDIFLTVLEKNILMLLVDQKEIEKNFLLESVLKLKRDTKTRTIESHLTRIRSKLSKINSRLKILSKGDKVFLI